MCKSNCEFLEPCKLTTIRFPHSARFSKIVQTGVYTDLFLRNSLAFMNIFIQQHNAQPQFKLQEVMQ